MSVAMMAATSVTTSVTTSVITRATTSASAGAQPGTAARAALRPVAGFEATEYAWRGDRIVWVGEGGHEHPRHLRRPWRAPAVALDVDAARLRAGARRCRALIGAGGPIVPHGLLAWLVGQALPFPWAAAAPRFDAARQALAQDDPLAFGAAARRLLGLGPGLTPSGDDFVGAVLFTFALAPGLPGAAWRSRLPALCAALREASAHATNAISAALLADLMAGAGYRALHEFVAALGSADDTRIVRAAQPLLRIGANSGADLLAGVLCALTAAPPSSTDRSSARSSDRSTEAPRPDHIEGTRNPAAPQEQP